MFKNLIRKINNLFSRKDKEENTVRYEVRHYSMATEDDLNRSLAQIAFKSEKEQKRLLEEFQSSTTIQDRIFNATEEARRLSAEGDTQQAAVQWDIVEELSAEAADMSLKYKLFCEENPSDHNCKMYDI